MDIGTQTVWKPKFTPGTPVLYQDIQSLVYEFDDNGGTEGSSSQRPVVETVFADVEIWRGAVARVNAKGELEVVGNEAGAIPVIFERDPDTGKVAAVVVPPEPLPMSDWEIAPSLKGNPNYNPMAATGAAFVEPLERAISIGENDVQKRAGDVQKRVRTFALFRFR
jgi:hypothetical protein